MVFDKKPKPKDIRVRKLVSFVRRLSDEEINIFLTVLEALMAQVPAPRDARKSYLKEVEVRLRNNGADFLSKARVFPTFGLKLLGNDRDRFPIPGFKTKEKRFTLRYLRGTGENSIGYQVLENLIKLTRFARSGFFVYYHFQK